MCLFHYVPTISNSKIDFLNSTHARPNTNLKLIVEKETITLLRLMLKSQVGDYVKLSLSLDPPLNLWVVPSCLLLPVARINSGLLITRGIAM